MIINVERHVRYWKDLDHQRSYLTWLGTKLNLNSEADWYSLTQDDFIQNEGGGLLNLYGGSPSKLLAAVMPERKWSVVSNIPRGSQVRSGHVISNAIRVNSLMSLAVNSRFSDQPSAHILRDSFRFGYLPLEKEDSSELSLDVARRLISHLESELHISPPSEWARISRKQVGKVGSWRLIERYGGLIKVLLILM